MIARELIHEYLSKELTISILSDTTVTVFIVYASTHPQLLPQLFTNIPKRPKLIIPKT